MIYHNFTIDILLMDRTKITYDSNGDIQYEAKDPYEINGYRGETFMFTSKRDCREQLEDYFFPATVRVEFDNSSIDITVVATANNAGPVDDACIQAVKEGRCCLWEISTSCSMYDDGLNGILDDMSVADIPATAEESRAIGIETSARLRQAWYYLWKDRCEDEANIPEYNTDVEDAILGGMEWDSMTTPQDIDEIKEAIEPYTVSVFNSLAEAYAAFTDVPTEATQKRLNETEPKPGSDYIDKCRFYDLCESLMDTVKWHESVCYTICDNYNHIVILHNY